MYCTINVQCLGYKYQSFDTVWGNNGGVLHQFIMFVIRITKRKKHHHTWLRVVIICMGDSLQHILVLRYHLKVILPKIPRKVTGNGCFLCMCIYEISLVQLIGLY